MFEFEFEGKTFFFSEWNMPDRKETSMTKYWMMGKKFVVAEQNERTVFIIFPTDIAHVEIATQKFGGMKIVSAGFTRLNEDDNEIETYGYSSSIQPSVRSRPEDKKIIREIYRLLEKQLEDSVAQ